MSDTSFSTSLACKSTLDGPRLRCQSPGQHRISTEAATAVFNNFAANAAKDPELAAAGVDPDSRIFEHGCAVRSRQPARPLCEGADPIRGFPCRGDAL